jgi:tryptophan-rich sensory protein
MHLKALWTWQLFVTFLFEFSIMRTENSRLFEQIVKPKYRQYSISK